MCVASIVMMLCIQGWEKQIYQVAYLVFAITVQEEECSKFLTPLSSLKPVPIQVWPSLISMSYQYYYITPDTTLLYYLICIRLSRYILFWLSAIMLSLYQSRDANLVSLNMYRTDTTQSRTQGSSILLRHYKYFLICIVQIQLNLELKVPQYYYVAISIP